MEHHLTNTAIQWCLCVLHLLHVTYVVTSLLLVCVRACLYVCVRVYMSDHLMWNVHTLTRTYVSFFFLCMGTSEEDNRNVPNEHGTKVEHWQKPSMCLCTRWHFNMQLNFSNQPNALFSCSQCVMSPLEMDKYNVTKSYPHIKKEIQQTSCSWEPMWYYKHTEHSRNETTHVNTQVHRRYGASRQVKWVVP